MDQRIYYINGKKQEAGTTYINALQNYLESTGQSSAFSLYPPPDCETPKGIKPPSHLTDPSSSEYVPGLLESWLKSGCPAGDEPINQESFLPSIGIKQPIPIKINFEIKL